MAGSEEPTQTVPMSGSFDEPMQDPPEDQELTTQSKSTKGKGAPCGPRNQGIDESNVQRSAYVKTKSQKVWENKKMEAMYTTADVTANASFATASLEAFHAAF